VLSLFGLVLAIGIVVDDAIVVVENIERNIALGMNPRDAAHETMDEVGGALIGIAVVLTAVFVPTAFIPGITGQFYKQFALTIAVATVLSAFNSLTLSPALGALLLRKHDPGHKPWFPLFRLGHWAGGWFNRGFDRMTSGYAVAVGAVARRRMVMLLLYAGLAAATVWLAQRVPTGFIPQLDRGYGIIVIQLPDGASLARTDAVVRQASEIALATPGIDRAVAFAGFSGATFTNAPNAGVIFTGFEPFKDRVAAHRPAGAIIGDLTQQLGSIDAAFIIAIPPPPVPGIGNNGGFKIQLQNRIGDDVLPVLGSAYQLMGRARTEPQLAGVFTTSIGNIFEALQVNLGSAYVNDFNAFGRIYQVRAQADLAFRTDPDDIERIKVRNASGGLVPLGSLVDIIDRTGPELVQRYNQYVSVPLQGNAAPGISSGQALAAMERLAAELLPAGMGYEWTELALQQQLTGNTATYIFGLCVLFVFLALAAQYESWSMPFAIVLIVPMSVLAALGGVSLRGMDNNILVQVGLVVLVGLAAKNAILIVEFARQLEAEGKTAYDAVVEACRLRLRPILMTALAFILGVVPLVTATGPGAEMRQAVGVAVFFGMLGVTVIGLFLTPVFYVVVRAIRWPKRKAAPPVATPVPTAGD
jgi:hydrophobic/amphiphilic exporter-1 (mainly G- bacteria), HAE1 family